MRFPILLLGLIGAVVTPGCSPLISLNPFVTEKEVALDSTLSGVWQEKDGDTTYVIRQKGNAYTIISVDQEVSKFEARLLKAGDATLADLVSVNEDPFQIAAHTPMRVWLEGATLRISFLDTDWLKQQAALQLPLQIIKDRTVITAPGDALRDFLVKYGGDARAHDEPQVFERAQ